MYWEQTNQWGVSMILQVGAVVLTTLTLVSAAFAGGGRYNEADVVAANVTCEELKTVIAAEDFTVVAGRFFNYTVMRSLDTALSYCAIPDFTATGGLFDTADTAFCATGYVCVLNPPKNENGGD